MTKIFNVTLKVTVLDFLDETLSANYFEGGLGERMLHVLIALLRYKNCWWQPGFHTGRKNVGSRQVCGNWKPLVLFCSPLF